MDCTVLFFPAGVSRTYDMNGAEENLHSRGVRASWLVLLLHLPFDNGIYLRGLCCHDL
jgi:hypothetical protein